MGLLPPQDEWISLGEYLRRRKLAKRGSKKNAALMAVAQDWAKKNRSGLMSAFIKAMRMQKINQALYFGSLLFLGGHSDWYLARRILISSAEDGVDPELMQVTAELFKRKESHRGVFETLSGAVAVCLGKNWWNCSYGRASTRAYFQAKKKDKPGQNSPAVLLDMLDKSIDNGYEGFVASQVLFNALSEMKGFDATTYYSWLVQKSKTKGYSTGDHRLVRAAEALEAVIQDVVKYGDWNWEYVLRYMTAMGSPDDEIDFAKFKEYNGRVGQIMDIANKDLMEMKVVLPPWAYDGMHASNKALYNWPDKRFAGFGPGFYNSVLQYREYGRLDPRDQAMLKGLEVPPEGLVLCNEHIEAVK